MVSRSGHSLAELVVTLTFVAGTLGVLAGASVTAGRWTSSSVRSQLGFGVAAATLDSLQAAPDPADGAVDQNGWMVSWRVEAGPADGIRVLRVTGRDPLTRDRIILEGIWVAAPIVLDGLPGEPTS